MQPETKEKPVRETAPHEFTPIEQWDQLAFSLIRQELAPKGYSEIKRGPWRGKVQSNIPFLPKSTVDRCQKGAAQLVRSYRESVKKGADRTISVLRISAEEIEEQIRKTHFFQVSKKARLRRELEKIKFGIGCHEAAKDNMDKTGIK